MKDDLKALLPVIRRFAFSLTGNMADADDLLQSTIEKILTKPVPEDVALLAWSYRVCRNLWIDEYRASKVRQAATQQPELQQASAPDETAVSDTITLSQITQAMDKLPNEQREVLALVAVQGMTYQDTATILSVPSGTVMSRLARARTRLAGLLNLSAGAPA